MPIFGSIVLDQSDTEYRFEKSNNIYKEGVYYALFFYARYLKTEDITHQDEAANYSLSNTNSSDSETKSIYKDP